MIKKSQKGPSPLAHLLKGETSYVSKKSKI